MLTFHQRGSLCDHLEPFRQTGKRIGFVPTMGALHDGHLSLIRSAIKDCDVVVCSIYVNPTQFDNVADLQKYPKTLEQDQAFLEQEGCHVLFAPDTTEMYPKPSILKFDFGSLERYMEGQYREGHFSGVATVVSKFFHIVRPDVAYFGQKDLQQLMIIRQLASDLSFPIEIIGHPIVREQDGLAMSSRNQRLNSKQRAVAPHVNKALHKAAQMLFEKSIDKIIKEIFQYFEKLDDTRLEYLEIVHAETLEPLEELHKGIPLAICIAVYVGDIRLIDNILL